VAAAVAAAPVAAASGGGGRIPVEKGLVESGKLSGSIEVHEDYAWLGNQVGCPLARVSCPVSRPPPRPLPTPASAPRFLRRPVDQVNIGDNNNKFYRGQVVKAGSAFYAWTRWGRVGEGGQNSLDGPTSEAAAVASFQAKFKSKSSYAWAG
jgi:predicted DNA-binding WGR domain protein